VGPPDPRRCAALDAIHVELEGAVIPGNRLPWLPFVCNNRGLFHDSCFKFTTPVGIVILKFVFALQRPMIIGFHRVANKGGEAYYYLASQSSAAHEGFPSRYSHQWDHDYVCDWHTWVFSDDGSIDSAWPLEILMNCVHIGHASLCSDSRWMPLDEVTRGLADVADLSDAEEEVPAEAEPRGDDPLITCPWLLDMEYWPHMEPQVDTAGLEDRQRLASEMDTAGFDLDVHEMVMRELEGARAILAAGVAAGGSDARVVLRGGHWTFAVHGVAFNEVRAEVHTGIGKRFMRLYSMCMSATFSIAKYGNEAAQQLALSWTHRIQYFIDAWVACGMRPQAFGPDVLVDYAETANATALYERGSAASRVRMRKIRKIRPRM
jgi:hypothetical protein